MITVKYVLKPKVLMDAGNAIYWRVNTHIINSVAKKTSNVTWPMFENQIAQLIKEAIND